MLGLMKHAKLAMQLFVMLLHTECLSPGSAPSPTLISCPLPMPSQTDILTCLDWRCEVPTPLHWLHTLMIADGRMPDGLVMEQPLEQQQDEQQDEQQRAKRPKLALPSTTTAAAVAASSPASSCSPVSASASPSSLADVSSSNHDDLIISSSTNAEHQGRVYMYKGGPVDRHDSEDDGGARRLRWDSDHGHLCRYLLELGVMTTQVGERRLMTVEPFCVCC